MRSTDASVSPIRCSWKLWHDGGGRVTAASLIGSAAARCLDQLRRLGNAPRRFFPSERGRAAARTIIGSLLARPLNLILSMATTGVLVRWIGVEQFGTWAVWQNMAGVLGVFALGVPLSLLNRLSSARAAGDERRQSQIVSTAFCMMIAAGVVVVMLAGIWFVFDPTFGGLTGAGRGSNDSAGTLCAAVFIAYAAILLSAGIFERITTSRQDGWISAGCQVAGNALGLVLVAAACVAGGTLPWIAAGWAAGSLGGLAINAMIARSRYGTWTSPSIGAFSTGEMRGLLGDGWQFMVLGFIGLVGLQSDPLLIGVWDAWHGSTHGARASAEMAIPLRFFNTVSAAIFVFLAPLWPAYADARARGDLAWSRRTLLMSLAATAITSVTLIVPATAWSDRLLSWWVGDDVHVPPALLHAFGWWSIATIVAYPVVMYLNGFGQLRVQVALGLVFLACVMPAKFIGLSWFGSTGMVTATVLTFIILQFVPLMGVAWSLGQAEANRS